MSSSPPRLKRDLGLIDVFAISTGAMFSSGFFLLPGLAFAQAGAYMILAYVLSAVLVVPAMLSKAELASALPKAGGTYYFLDRAMGPLIGTVGGLGTWIAMGLKNTFALIGIGAYLSLYVDYEIEAIALALAVAFTVINIVGTKETARLQRWLVYALVGILVAFVISGLIVVGLDDGLVRATRTTFAAAPDASVDGVLATVGLVFVSYAGLTKVSGVAEEVDDPHRNIILGMVISLVVAVVIYALGTYLLVLVVPADALLVDLAPVATAAEPVFDWMPSGVGVALVVVAAIAAFASTANAGILSASRYLFAMGRDRLIGGAFQRITRFGTPALAVLATGGFVMAAVVTLDVMTVAKLASAFQLLMFALVNLAVIVMRESHIETYDPAVRTPLYPWTQILGIFLSLGLIVEMGRLPMLFTLGLVGVCVSWFFLYARGRVVREGAILHWFERLGRRRFDDLEKEMWEILKESGVREHDPYEELIGRAVILELEEREPFARVAELVATRMQLETESLKTAFEQRVKSGLVPVADGVAVVHLHDPDQTTHELSMLRTRQPVVVELDELVVEVEALFFLVSPAGDPGQHLRLLAKLTTQIDQPEFVERWRASETHTELRQLLTDEPLTRLARRLNRELRTPARIWRPRHEPGRFESIMVLELGRQLDEETLAFAESLAVANGASLTLAEHTADDEPASERLPEMARELRERGIEAHAVGLSGRVWLEAIRAVLRNEHDLVIAAVAARKRGFDASTKHLLRKLPCPVWVANPNRPLRVRKVLAAVDVTSQDRARRSLNAQLLGFASSLAERCGGEMHIVHAFPAGGQETLLRDSLVPGERDWRAEYRRLIHELLKGQRLEPDRTHIHVIEGKPDHVIVDFAKREEIDLVVMGTVCRTGVAGLLIGNTAESVLEEVGCSVLAVKPIGFQTSVDLDDSNVDDG